MSTQRAVTNRLMHQANLMAELSNADSRSAMQQAANDALVLFQYQALCSALLEVGEHYQVRLQPQVPNLVALLETLGQSRPDCWEYRTLTEALRSPAHWVYHLQQAIKFGVSKVPEQRSKAVDSGQLISVSVADDSTTNHYPNIQADLQQWIDEMRSMNDQH